MVASLKQENHNSRINYKTPVLNTYDRGHMSVCICWDGGVKIH